MILESVYTPMLSRSTAIALGIDPNTLETNAVSRSLQHRVKLISIFI